MKILIDRFMRISQKQITMPKLLMVFVLGLICLFPANKLSAFDFPETAVDCFVEEISVMPQPCDAEGNYMVSLDFIFGDENGDDFKVQGNGVIYGTFAYADLPVTIGPFSGDGQSVYELAIIDETNPDCGNFTEWESPNCADLCVQFEDFEEGILYAESTGYEPGDLIGTEDGVSIYLFENLNQNGEPAGFGTIQIWDNPLGSGTNGLAPFFGGASLLFDFAGLPEAVSAVTFSYVGAHANFGVNGNLYYLFDGFGELANINIPGITITVNPTPTSVGSLTVEGDIQSLVLGGFDVAIDDVCFVTSPCMIYDPTVTYGPCSSDDQRPVFLDFEYAYVGSDEFIVYDPITNEEWGPYAYADLPVNLGLFNGNGALYSLVIHDVDYQDCGVDLGFEVPGGCDDECIRFEDLEEGTIYSEDAGYEVGDVILEEDGVSISLANFIETSGATGFGSIEIHEDFFPGGGMNGLAPIFLFGSLEFDFSGLSEQVTAITFNYAGGYANFGLNDDPVYSLINGFGELADLTIPGFEIEVTPITNNSGSVTIYGPIDQLLLGGLTAAVDDICFVTESCSIENFTAEVVNTFPGGAAVEIDFETNVVPSSEFTVYVNGEAIEQYEVEDLPLDFILPCNLLGDDFLAEIKVCFDNAQACCATTTIEIPECEGSCLLSNLVLEPQDCTPNNIFYLDIDFEHENGGDQFSLWIGDEYYGIFNYADLPLSLGPLAGDGSTVYEVHIEGFADQFCTLDGEVGPVDCDPASCTITDLSAELIEGNADGSWFLVDFNFSPATTSGFLAYFNGELLDDYPLANLPVEVFVPCNLLDPGTNGGELKICLNNSQSCCETVFVELPDCFQNNCEIWDIVAEATDCTPNGIFFVDLDFNHNNTSDVFKVFGNGVVYGEFEYAALPITLGPFPGDGTTVYEFIIQDLEYSDCGGEIGVGPIDCGIGNCELWDLVIEPYDCDNSGQFLVDIDFNFANVGTDGFSVFGNGNNYGTFGYDELPITLGPLNGDGTTAYEFVIKDNNHPDCSVVGVIDPVDCGNTACDISDLGAEIIEDNADGAWILVDFEYVGVGNLGFDLTFNGEFIGFYSYNELPVEAFIPCNLVDPNGGGVLVVCENDNTNCCADLFMILPDCVNTGNCELWDLVIEPYDCDNSGQFLVDIDFNYANVGTEGFSVFGNGNNYGSFGYDELPITLGPLNGDGTTIYEFIIKDNEHPDCNIEGVIDPVDCGTASCDISDFFAEIISSNADGANVLIDLNYSGPNEVNFNVFFNDEYLGFYYYDELPVDIFIPCNLTGPDGEGILTVCDETDPNCCESLTMVLPDCAGGNCEIWDLVAETTDCGANGEFYAVIDFNYANTSDVFKVFGNGQIYGEFEYASLPITIGPFTGDGNTVYEIIVQDLVYQDCGDEIVIGPIDCGVGDCELWDLVIEPYDCDPTTGTFLVDIDFNFDGVGPDGFSVFGNGNDYGSFGYDELPITLGPFDGDGMTTYEFIIKDNANPDCSVAGFIDPVDCDPVACEIFDLGVEILSSNNDGSVVLIDFEYTGVGNLGFDVFFNDESLGFYSYNDLPIEVFIPCDLIDANGGGQLVVCDNDSQCCEDLYITLPDCSVGICEIWDIVAEATDCGANGEFYVVIDFNYANTSDVFKIFGNGQIYGEFEYSSLPVTLGPFTGDGTTVYEFIVQDLEYPDCGGEVGVGPIDCGVGGNCEIYDLTAELLNANADGATYLIDFEYTGVAGLGFDVIFNGETIGFYDYNALPVEIFIPCEYGSSNNSGILWVCENDDMSCCADLYLELPECEEPCEIDNLVAFHLNSDPEGAYYLIDFDFANVAGDGFDVFFNGEFLGYYGYNELPLEIYIPCYLTNDDQGGFITVCENDMSNCCATTYVTLPDCPVGECAIEGLTIETTPCTGVGFFYATLDFEYENVGDEGFYVAINGIVNGPFGYDELPLEVGPFLGNGSTDYEFIVFDAEDFDCYDQTTLEAIDCNGSCDIMEVYADVVEVTPNGYTIFINFTYNNVGDLFDVYFGNLYIGTFEYSQIPLEVQVPCSPTLVGQVTICDHDNPNCCETYDLQLPPCGNGCTLFDMEAQAFDCDDEGQFMVELDFEYLNSSDQFTLQGNGAFYGTFNYAELPIILGPFPGDGQTVWEFVATDVNDPECSTFVEYGPVECSDFCMVSDLEADLLEAGPNGYAYLINFEYENVTSTGFDVYFGDVFIGFFDYDELPLELELPCASTPVADLTVCANDQNSCCTSIDLILPPCSEDCAIVGLTVTQECTSSGEVYGILDFDFANVGDEGFSLSINNVASGLFDYSELPLELGPFMPDPNETYVFIVEDVANSNCGAVYTAVFEPCDPDCAVNDLSAEVIEITPNGIMYELNFEYDLTIADGVDVYFNDEFVGYYPFDQYPPMVYIPCQNITSGVFEVCVNDNPACCTTVEVEIPDCTACNIFDVIAETHPCDDNGNFLVDIEIDHINTGNNGYVITTNNGVQYGPFGYDEIFVTIGPFPGDNNIVYEFVISDVDDPDCAATIEVGPIDCLGTCEIGGLEVETGDCDPTTNTYPIWINFEYENATNDYFDLYSQGELIGYFLLDELPLELDAFPASGDEYDELTVCINDNINCCAMIEFEAPDCGPNLQDVWPGDADNNNIAHNFDLLKVGIAYGATGPQRDEVGIDWSAFTAQDWDEAFEADGLNLKFADCNGDGVIDDSDVEAIHQNYNSTHGAVPPYVAIEGSNDDPHIYVDLPAGELLAGEPFEAPVILGEEDLPVEDIYGIAFTLVFDPTVVLPNSVQLEFGNGWMGAPGINLLTLEASNLINTGRIDVALVRNDQNDVSGFGEITRFIGIIDDVLGKEELAIEVQNIKAIKFNEAPIPLFKVLKVVDIINDVDETLTQSFKVYPNPTHDIVYFDAPSDLTIESVRIRNANGKLMREVAITDRQIELDNLASGIYILEFQTSKGWVHKRIAKF